MGQQLDELRAELPLNVNVQTFLDALDDKRRDQLAGIINQAVASQDQRIDAAGDEALRLVPKVFRGSVKKMLFGEQN